MTTQEVANRLVELCRQGQIETAQQELFADNVVSIEPAGSPMERAEGKEAIIEKGKQFQAMIEEFHGQNISEPIVADDHFAITWEMDCTFKGQGRRKMNEICLYNVQNGKIATEQFIYSMPAQN